MKKILFLLLIIQTLVAQNIPFEMDHPIYHFLERQESRGYITAEYWSTRPYSYVQINTMLAEIETHLSALSTLDRDILQRFQREFDREFENDDITFPWSKSTLASLRHPDTEQIKPLFMTYKQGAASGWISWSETFRIQNNGQANRGYYTDHLGIYGVKGSISFTSQFTYHRVTKNDHFTDLPDTYREGYFLDRDYIDWITWDYPTSSLIYTHPDFTIGIHRQPIYWGYSAANSPILSDNVNPLPHIQWTTEAKHIRYKFIHAKLSPNEPLLADTLNTRRNLSAHRVEFDLSSTFEFAFNEMVVYAHRDFELAYLNPVNFLFSEEHVQGDLDNLLMALDFKWQVIPGLTTYGTWFFDELDFFKLFSGWWGNKFVFQLGANYYPKANLPSLGLEYTAARPWTYSHEYPVNSFTSAGRPLGLIDGPNTSSLRISSNWQARPRLFIQGEVEHLQHGDDPGADILNSYINRTDEEGDDVQFLNGTITTENRFHLSLDYYISRILILNIQTRDDSFFEVGMRLEW